MFLVNFHNFGGMVTIVGPVWSAVVVVGLSENEDIITTTEGILEDSNRPQVDVGVATRSLVGGRTIEIPDSQLANVGDLLVDCL